MKNLVPVLSFVFLSLGLFAQDPPAPSSSEDVNYAFGILLGESLATTGLEFDLATVSQGIRDVLSQDKKRRLDSEQAKQIVSSALQAAQEKRAVVQKQNEAVYLAEHGKKKGVVTTASGLQYEVLKKGTGLRPKTEDTVKVDYVGTLTDGTKFDSSIDRGEPAVFGLAQVIPGWTEGIMLMEVGAKYRLTIPSGLAYGAEGAGGVIPPYATLVFEVDLLSIEAPGVAETQ